MKICYKCGYVFADGNKCLNRDCGFIADNWKDEIRNLYLQNKELKQYLKELTISLGLVSTNAEFKRCLLGGAFKESMIKRAVDLKEKAWMYDELE